MTTSRSPLYSILTVVFGLVVLAGGVAKLLQGVKGMSSSGENPQIRELLRAGDSTVEEANQLLEAVVPSMQKLLVDFDELEINAYRKENAESCSKVKSDFTTANAKLKSAIQKIDDATKLGMDPKLNPFMEARSKSYAQLIQVNTNNIEMIDVLMDTQLVDREMIVDKITAIAGRRDEAQQAFDSSSATATELLAQLLMSKN